MTTAVCALEGNECRFVVATPTHAIPELGATEAVSCGLRALEGHIDPPYRAVMARRDADVWAVGAVAIEVAELPELEGSELILVRHPDGSRELVVDGRPRLLLGEALASLAGGRAGAYVLRAARLDARFWEFRVDPL